MPCLQGEFLYKKTKGNKNPTSAWGEMKEETGKKETNREIDVFTIAVRTAQALSPALRQEEEGLEQVHFSTRSNMDNVVAVLLLPQVRTWHSQSISAWLTAVESTIRRMPGRSRSQFQGQAPDQDQSLSPLTAPLRRPGKAARWGWDCPCS